MKNTVKRDQYIIKLLVNKYGKDDVCKFVGKVNEDFASMMAGLNSGVFSDVVRRHDESGDERNEIEEWLHANHIYEYELFYDNSVKLDQDVDFSNKNLYSFPPFIKFRETGENCHSFNLSGNHFSETKQLPKTLYNCVLDLSNNDYTDLYNYISNMQGGPETRIIVAGNPNLKMHYEYVTKNSFVDIDQEQYDRFFEEKTRR